MDPKINVSNYPETFSFQNPQGIWKGFEQHQSYGQGNCSNYTHLETFLWKLYLYL